MKDDAPDLATLQTSFAQALQYRPSDVAGLITDNLFSAEQRLQIYRNNFVISLSEVLEATYPAVKAVVGDECFSALARQHILTTPLEQGDVSHYGGGFDQTICAQATLTDAVPYLADLAALEWLVDRASMCNAALAAFPLEKLQGLTEQRLAEARLIPHPACWLLDSDYAVASLWLAIRDEQLDGLTIRTSESAIVLPGPAVIATTQAGTALVQLARQHQPLGQASQDMLAVLGELIAAQVFSDILYADEM
ncbi:DNA-binding domain-containing protein [Photobacterium sp. WH77]|uniref:HvfC/BufC N-terminal domain-containing protein n=1 Tax=Photobacterium TaxID=657 RepID=UPI001C4898FA|nr:MULTISPECIES: DNA-binding domain-containing protein [Photobacterium]MBV7263578.1 putative DNA-binding domain-containing protein [Photobacterium sp. WH24]MCG2838252.1 DNA-binding domain-containing protein [Photobacterium sp. WH77]MCG2845869.1 DNA-binding domain-containing protein [Photobacterium sp. WH80]